MDPHVRVSHRAVSRGKRETNDRPCEHRSRRRRTPIRKQPSHVARPPPAADSGSSGCTGTHALAHRGGTGARGDRKSIPLPERSDGSARRMWCHAIVAGLHGASFGMCAADTHLCSAGAFGTKATWRPGMSRVSLPSGQRVRTTTRSARGCCCNTKQRCGSCPNTRWRETSCPPPRHILGPLALACNHGNEERVHLLLHNGASQRDM
mmetsp:Transcript_7049/g.18102  ORF Transcript_7049/g.18102 Transcript_7049/m.18102 type:complete len:207 (+) Transcript_7049:6484-7104(+)